MTAFFLPNFIISGYFEHSHKKRKDSRKKRAVLLIFLLELEICGAAVQSIHQNREKWWILLGTKKAAEVAQKKEQ